MEDKSATAKEDEKKPAETSCAAATEQTETAAETRPMMEQVYDLINEVIGATSKDQFLCMTIPGQVLDVASYKYDVKRPKPFRVAAAESRLANKLFDPAKLTGSDNGHLLASQYLAALDVLTPKVNVDLAKTKNAIRELLFTPMSYIDERGVRTEGTVQQVFYKVYEEWVNEKKLWQEAQNAKQEALYAVYDRNSDDDMALFQEKYLEWYQTVADGYITKINEKLARASAVFSPNDMAVIVGILQSGSGSEIEDERERVVNARRYDPDGGYVYPVTFEPANWIDYADSSFDFVDLLQSPDAYDAKLRVLKRQWQSLSDKIAAFEAKDNSSSRKELAVRAAEAGKALENSEKTLNEKFAKSANMTAEIVRRIVELAKTGANADETEKTVNAGKKENDKIKINDVTAMFAEMDSALHGYIAAAGAYTEAIRKAIEADAQDMHDFIKPMYAKAQALKSEIDEVQAQREFSGYKYESGRDFTNSIFPDTIAKGYSLLQASFATQSLAQRSSDSSMSTESSYGVNFLFGGYRKKDSKATAVFDAMKDDNGIRINIAFLAMKVNMTRNWLNPGVFKLTRDMYNSTSVRISAGDTDNFDEMSKCLFPCYPTSFLLAKDITIQFEYSHEMSSEHRDALREHHESGGGFLFFHGSSASSGASNNAASSFGSTDKTVNIKIPGPQIIGYYLEKTPKDLSTPLAQTAGSPTYSIMEFARDCVKMYAGK